MTIKALYELLEYTNYISIYKYYLKTAVINVKLQYYAPYRVDEHCSIKLYYSGDELLWRDMTTSLGGNCIKLVKVIYETRYKITLDYIETLNKIYETIPDFIHNEINKQKCQILKIVNNSNRSKTPNMIEYVPNMYNGKAVYTKSDLKYWAQGFLEAKHLIKESIKSANIVTLNGKPVWTYSRLNPIYIYEYLINGVRYVKGYRPFELDKNRKWLCNFDDTSIAIEGYSSLNKTGNVLIITKSKKDYMVLKYVYGYNCISPQSENSLIFFEILEDLKERFKYIILLYDNDKAGIKLSKKFKIEYGILNVFIPKKLSKDIFELCTLIKDKEIVGNIIHSMIKTTLTYNSNNDGNRKFYRESIIYHKTSDSSSGRRRLLIMYR